MKTSLSAKLVFFLLLFSVVVHAQPKTLPAWSYKFKTPIQWQRVHSLGHVIVSTSEGLFAINPSDGRLIWENRQFPSLNPDMYSEIAGTEFISISYLTEKSSTIPMQAIVEVVGGKVLFDSQKESIGVLSRHVLPSSGKLLVIGMKPKNLV